MALPPDFDCSQYDYRKVRGYFPDINKEEVRELYLHKAMKLIDCGVNVIWIDMLHMQLLHFYRMSQDIDHPAIGQTLESISKLVEEIHEYGFSKGKYVYVGSWAPLIRNDKDILIPLLLRLLMTILLFLQVQKKFYLRSYMKRSGKGLFQ